MKKISDSFLFRIIISIIKISQTNTSTTNHLHQQNTRLLRIELIKIISFPYLQRLFHKPKAPQPLSFNTKDLELEMANKLAPWVLPEPVLVLRGNPRIDWVWVWGISNFFNWVWGWVWGCTYSRHNTRPCHISISPFKLLKYLQLIK